MNTVLIALRNGEREHCGRRKTDKMLDRTHEISEYSSDGFSNGRYVPDYGDIGLSDYTPELPSDLPPMGSYDQMIGMAAQTRSDMRAMTLDGKMPVLDPAKLRDDTEELTRRTGLPVIDYVPSMIDHVVNVAADAAARSGLQWYQRGGELVAPVMKTEPGVRSDNISRAASSAVLVPVTKARAIADLSHAINWQKFDGRSEKLKPIACPPAVAETILSRTGDELPFPPLLAIINAPTMRPDGSILNLPGFDHDTGIMFASKVEWPMVPEAPTLEAAKQALERLKGPISKFPFVAPSDRSAMLAMLLTAVVRPCLPSAPMFGVTAPTPGTGKGKAIAVASVLSTGLPPAVLNVPTADDELEKRVGSSLKRGDQFLTLDNIERPLGSSFLEQLLTERTVSVRVLGESTNLTLPTNALFCATGNGLRFKGDMARRVVIIRLDAKVERPELLTYAFDPIEVATKNRVDLVIDALTILRAFVVQRGPKITPRLGSFETWSDLVRSALLWLGEADPLANTDDVREGDPDREEATDILHALARAKPNGERFTAAEIGKLVDGDKSMSDDFKKYEDLSEALSKFFKQGALDARYLGNWIKHKKDRIFDGLRIVQTGKDRTGKVLWLVENLNSPAPHEGVF